MKVLARRMSFLINLPIKSQKYKVARKGVGSIIIFQAIGERAVFKNYCICCFAR